MKYRVGGGGAVGGLVRVGEAVSRAPPELREWLDAKLEQVGVDPSPTYARYVLGLLLQPEGEGVEEDTGADDEEDLKGSNESRRRRRQGKRQSVVETAVGYSWPGECPTTRKDVKVVNSELGKSRKRSRASTGRYRGVFGDGEFRKRSAAIDCLMSASDQKSGIEKLVDELCVKLKQIQNEAVDGNIFNLELSQSSEGFKGNATKCSVQDQAEKYYAAFPPLKKLEDKSSNNSMTLSFDNTCAWNNRKVLSKCIGRNKKNEVWLLNEQMNETRVGENKENVKKKGFGRVFGENSVWGMPGTWRETHNQIGLKENLGGKFTTRHQRVPYSKARRDQNRFCKENGHENEEGNNCKTDPVRMVLMMALASSAKMWSGSSQRYSLGESELDESNECDKQFVRRRLYELKRSAWEDENVISKKYPMDGESDEECLASLFAKFDRRMEALWELEPENEFPPSFSVLANMSSGQNTKAVNSKASPNYSFILSGTNITSSIWSQCPINNCLPVNSRNVIPNGKEVTSDCYNGSKVVGNELKNLSMKTTLISPNLENFHIIWEESTNLFPPQAIGVEKVMSAHDGDTSSLEMKEEEPQKQSHLEGGRILLSPHVCYDSVTKESLETLNHSREKSSFTEVTPRINLKCQSCATTDQVESKLHWSPVISCASLQPPKLNSEEEEVEEDLLTSSRTHFLPIRRLSVDSSSGMSETNSGGGVNYEDGTTFSIQSTMEKVTFYRSESGHLILKEEPEENEDGSVKGTCKTPKKYMVYKGAVGLKGRGWLADQDDSGFLPKFLVRQNEKSCQTDENDEQFKGDADANCCCMQVKSSEVSVEAEEVPKGEEVEFFFPGDSHLAKDLDSMDQEEVEERKIEPASEELQDSSTNPQIPSNKSIDNETLLQDSWSKFPSVVCHCSASSSETALSDNRWEQRNCNGQCWNKIWKSPPEVPYCSLREMEDLPNSQTLDNSNGTGELQSKLLRQELSEESEQLFADLHMVRQMYLGMEWMSQEDAAFDVHLEVEKSSPHCDDIPSNRKRNLLAWSKESNKLPHVTSGENFVSASDKQKKNPNMNCFDFDLLEEIFGPVDSEQMENLLKTTVAPKGVLFSFELEAEWKKNDRNTNSKTCQNDHKRRRHSSGRGPRRDVMNRSGQLQIQKRPPPCSFFVSEGGCHRSNCRFSHDLGSVPCRFWSDGSCLRGIACPFLHSSAPSVSSGSPSSPLSPPPHRPRKQNYIPILPFCEYSPEDPSIRPITL